MFRVLFVCTGNTCRSPMAQSILQDLVQSGGKGDDFFVESAGLAAYAGDRTTREALGALQRIGLSGSNRAARRVNQELLATMDLVLTMTDNHRRELLNRHPEMGGRVWTIGGYCGCGGDVVDPIGGDASAYDSCARQLQKLVVHAWPKIQQEAGKKQTGDETIG